VLAYGVGLLVGLGMAALMLPGDTLAGTGGMFRYPVGDLATNLAGHLAFQAPGWHWPPLRTPSLALPDGESVAMMDANPILSVAAKLVSPLAGHPINLFGAWLALCMVLQATGAVYVLRGFTGGVLPGGRVASIATAAAAAKLAVMLPEFLFRVFHINLMGQFLLLAALGVSLRHGEAKPAPRFAAMLGLLTLAVFIHPYLFIFCAITLAGPAVHRLLRRQPGARAAVRNFALAAQIPAALFLLVNGSSGAGGGPGFGLYSMNLAGPVWPQRSGLFGASLPVLDATGYQHEGFNYLGAGVLLLLAAAAICLARAGRACRADIWRRHCGLIVVLAAMTALAITPRLTFGHSVILPLTVPGFDRLFGVVRASGRAIWVVDFALIGASLSLLAARLKPPPLILLLVTVLLLQWLDTAPLRHDAQAYFAGAGQSPPPVSLPATTHLLRVVPHCGGSEDAAADPIRLLAIRQGIALANARLAHPPSDEVCAQTAAEGLATPVAPGEARLFLPSLQSQVDRGHLGTAAVCTPSPAGLLCTNG
jgi:hypothetical protein